MSAEITNAEESVFYVDTNNGDGATEPTLTVSATRSIPSDDGAVEVQPLYRHLKHKGEYYGTVCVVADGSAGFSILRNGDIFIKKEGCRIARQRAYMRRLGGDVLLASWGVYGPPVLPFYRHLHVLRSVHFLREAMTKRISSLTTKTEKANV